MSDTTFIKSEGEAFIIPPLDVYEIRYDGVVREMEFEADKPGDPPDISMQLQFAIDDPNSDQDGTEFRAWFPKKVTDGNKTGRLFAALLGVDVVPDQVRNSELIGRRCRATVGPEMKNGKERLSLKSPLPLRARRQEAVAVGSEPPF